MTHNKKKYVLDTNVLIHDPSSIERFEDNDLYIPIYVLEEIDGLKNDMVGEKGRNARRITRTLDKLRSQNKLTEGVNISDSIDGKLFIYVPSWYHDRVKPYPVTSGWMDTAILDSAKEIEAEDSYVQTIFVTMDINLRVRAEIFGLCTEGYKFQSVSPKNLGNSIIEVAMDDEFVDNLYKGTGMPLCEEDVVKHNIKENSSVMVNSATKSFLGIYKDKKLNKLNVPREGILGIKPKNKEQQFALNLLLDDTIKMVTLMGVSGAGKTLLALAASLHMVLEGRYDKILISRPIMPLGRDLGFLPGTTFDKILPYMQPFYDNLDYIMMSGKVKSSYGKSSIDELMETKIQMEPLTYIRGRSIANQIILTDEVQNTSAHELKTLISRCGENTKLILTGDPDQIDNPYLDSSSNGLSVVVKKITDEPSVGHLLLKKGHRSELADIAVKYL
jgi:PhoH-like ATPase